MKSFIIILYKVFFIGLLLQFFLHTTVHFGIGVDVARVENIWLRKEAIIWLLTLIILRDILFKWWRKWLFRPKLLWGWTLLVIAWIVGTALIHLTILDLPLGQYLLAFKYDFFWFIILLVWFHSSHWLEQEDKKNLLLWYWKVIQWTLVLSFIRYFIVSIKPWTLKLFGYDNFVFEWNVGQQPPAVYYTHINSGLPRNQFLFERPITRWFFLTAFWPIFFVLFLFKKPVREVWWRWLVYWLNILFTFSRAAWISWVIWILLIWAVFYASSLKKFFVKILIPVILLLGVVGYLWYDMIIDRWYSNTWHMEMVKQWMDLFIERPFWWHGGATAWPGSHRNGAWFNPENQFLQIMIEFGMVWFILRWLAYWVLNIIWFWQPRKLIKKWLDGQLLIAASIWMICLSVSWLVLHSFSDRMVVYPFMLYFWILLWLLFHKTRTQIHYDHKTFQAVWQQ